MGPNWQELLERIIKSADSTGRDGFLFDDSGARVCICRCQLPGEYLGAYDRWDRREHAPDCPWRLAKEALQEWDDFPRFRVFATVPPGEPGPGWSAWNLNTEGAAGALVRDLHLNGLEGMPVCSIQFDELEPDGSTEFIYGFKYEPIPDGEGGYVPYIPDWVTPDWLPERPQRNAGLRRGFSGAASRD